MSNLRAIASFGSSLVIFGLVLATQTFAGCSASPTPAGSACTSDTDCDGDATCVDGQCVTESGGSGSSGSSGSGGSGSGSSSSGSVQLPPACYQTCTTEADCTNGNNSPLTGPDNWNCNGGVCQYKGCNSTQECTDTYMKPNYTCTALGGATINSCYQTCTAAVDCTNGAMVPLLDADNWACNAGVCEYKGCNTTQECTDTYMNPQYDCVALAGATTKACVLKCTGVADCEVPNAPPLSNADNYECNGGICEYIGCNTTQECTDTYMQPNYVCK